MIVSDYGALVEQDPSSSVSGIETTTKIQCQKQFSGFLSGSDPQVLRKTTELKNFRTQASSSSLLVLGWPWNFHCRVSKGLHLI